MFNPWLIYPHDDLCDRNAKARRRREGVIIRIPHLEKEREELRAILDAHNREMEAMIRLTVGCLPAVFGVKHDKDHRRV